MTTGTSGPPGRGDRERPRRRRPGTGIGRARGALARAVPRLRAELPAAHPDSAAVRITAEQAGWLADTDSELWPRRRRRVLDQSARLGRWLGRPVWTVRVPLPMREGSGASAARALASLVRPLALVAAALAAAHALLASSPWTTGLAIALYLAMYLTTVKLVVVRPRPRPRPARSPGAASQPPGRAQ